ncbi:hypothetical protein GCM10009557_05020 [Virgisporangium ochraceum]|uniref:Uncharacterized protein n=1 Tax=Virgisporangium ochraceum TaxID=65505 RepID=A0A8J3ZW00_9ACTN|nr:hypothetical protein [Virgisporangium ochraceum]GIJ70203.1 hypothetical protein Voc01_051200 [Virgisporangium ochraceum]
MTILGVSGHQRLPARGRDFIISEVKKILNSAERPLIGVGCLAAGADQLFARLILESGGDLRAVIPCREYEQTFSTPSERDNYLSLLGFATQVVSLTNYPCGEKAFMEAGREIVRESESLVAIWDGMPARGLGGTADVVEYARKLSLEVTVVWPAGVRRP